MKIEDIKTIVSLMSEHDLTEVKIESNGDNVCIRRGSKLAPVPQMLAVPAPVAAPVAPPIAVAAPSAAPSAPAVLSASQTITAPLVGTFYRCASPDSPPFVKVGDKVTPDTVVAIIEAMKVMNEIKAEKSGVIKDCLAENGQPVEYGQTLYIIE